MIRRNVAQVAALAAMSVGADASVALPDQGSRPRAKLRVAMRGSSKGNHRVPVYELAARKRRARQTHPHKRGKRGAW